MKRLCIALALVCVAVLPVIAQTSNNNSRQRGSWEIVSADYGWGNNWVDVTDRVRSLVQNDALNFRVSGMVLGTQSRRNANRTLRLQLRANDGRTRQVTYTDNQQVNLRISRAYQSGLRINRAVYASQDRSLDVTSLLSSQIQGEQLSILVNDRTMGGDPDPRQPKTLTVDYSLNGRAQQAVVRENDTLRLPYGEENRSNLQITRAVYGSAYHTSDVTSRLNSQVRDDQLNLQVNNDTMGGDPAPRQAKSLTVEYSLNGRTSQVVVNDGDTLHLPYGSNNIFSNNFSQRVRCESAQSNNFGRKYCPADTRGGVRLIRQISGSRCSEGSSWGYDTHGVWVDNGCQAEFELSGNGRTTGSLTTIPSGTELSVRTNEPIDSRNATAEQKFSAVIAEDVRDGTGAVTIPRGSDAELVIRGNNSSDSNLVLDVDSITVSGTRYQVSTDDMEQQGGQGVGANKKTAIYVGGGAALGTVIGAIVGGGKGAAIGAAVGAGAGLGTEVLTKGSQVRVPTETLLRFRLDQDLRLRPARSGYRSSWPGSQANN